MGNTNKTTQQIPVADPMLVEQGILRELIAQCDRKNCISLEKTLEFLSVEFSNFELALTAIGRPDRALLMANLLISYCLHGDQLPKEARSRFLDMLVDAYTVIRKQTTPEDLDRIRCWGHEDFNAIFYTFSLPLYDVELPPLSYATLTHSPEIVSDLLEKIITVGVSRTILDRDGLDRYYHCGIIGGGGPGPLDIDIYNILGLPLGRWKQNMGRFSYGPESLTLYSTYISVWVPPFRDIQFEKGYFPDNATLLAIAMQYSPPIYETILNRMGPDQLPRYTCEAFLEHINTALDSKKFEDLLLELLACQKLSQENETIVRTADWIEEEAPADSDASLVLPVLLLRAVLFEHTNLLLRRKVQKDDSLGTARTCSL